MPKHFQVVPVFNGNMEVLSPVSAAKARLLIKKRKAKVICYNPFVIRLNYAKKLTDRDK
jgi:hypothetical protein